MLGVEQSEEAAEVLEEERDHAVLRECVNDECDTSLNSDR